MISLKIFRSSASLISCLLLINCGSSNHTAKSKTQQDTASSAVASDSTQGHNSANVSSLPSTVQAGAQDAPPPITPSSQAPTTNQQDTNNPAAQLSQINNQLGNQLNSVLSSPNSGAILQQLLSSGSNALTGSGLNGSLSSVQNILASTGLTSSQLSKLNPSQLTSVLNNPSSAASLINQFGLGLPTTVTGQPAMNTTHQGTGSATNLPTLGSNPPVK